MIGQTPSVQSPTVENQTILEQKDQTKNTEQKEASITTNRVVKGIVTEQDEETPLFGATLYIKGTEIGTITDKSGKFELTVPKDLQEIELEVSYIGFEPQTLLFNHKYPIPTQAISINLGFNHREMIMGIMIATEPNGATCHEAIEVEVPHNLPKVESAVTVKEALSEPAISVYPNPFVSNLNVTYNATQKDDFLFLLYDVKGQLVFAKSFHLPKGEQNINLDISAQQLPDGVYILQISDSGDRIIGSRKVYKGQA